MRRNTAATAINGKHRILETGCWEWCATKDRGGYGRVRVAGELRGAHIVSYELHNGPVPSALRVLHRCDNPSCINPEHLFIGSQEQNVLDSIDKGRFRKEVTHCPAGHPYDAENTSYRRRKHGASKRCRRCDADRARRARRSIKP